MTSTFAEMKARYAKEKRDTVQRLADTGMFQADAARILGITRPALTMYARREGIKFAISPKGQAAVDYWKARA